MTTKHHTRCRSGHSDYSRLRVDGREIWWFQVRTFSSCWRPLKSSWCTWKFRVPVRCSVKRLLHSGSLATSPILSCCDHWWQSHDTVHQEHREYTTLLLNCHEVSYTFELWLEVLRVDFTCVSPSCNRYGPRNGDLRTQKLNSHLVRAQSLNVLPVKPGVGQYIAIHATLTDRDFFLAYFLPFQVHSPALFSKFLPIFYPVLAEANTGSCVGPQNK